MRGRRDDVGVADQGHFKGRLRHATAIDGGLEEGGVRAGEIRGRVRRWSMSDRKDFASIVLFETGDSILRGQTLVDIVFLNGCRGRQWQARPDHLVGIERWNEKRELLGTQVVDERTIRKITSGKIEERSTLSGENSGQSMLAHEVIDAVLA